MSDNKAEPAEPLVFLTEHVLNSSYGLLNSTIEDTLLHYEAKE